MKLKCFPGLQDFSDRFSRGTREKQKNLKTEKNSSCLNPARDTKMIVAGLQKRSLVDLPGKPAVVFFCRGAILDVDIVRIPILFQRRGFPRVKREKSLIT